MTNKNIRLAAVKKLAETDPKFAKDYAKAYDGAVKIGYSRTLFMDHWLANPYPGYRKHLTREASALNGVDTTETFSAEECDALYKARKAAWEAECK